jgi:hypothetical protein
LACGAYWSARVEDLLRGCARDRDLLPDDRTVDVRFHELLADELGTVAQVYAAAEQPFTDTTAAAMRRFAADHPRGRHGSVVYDLADFGLDPAERRAALRDYSDRFGTLEEAVPG